jgi:hypothetical protein
MTDDLVAKAWSEARVETIRSLRARAAEYDRVAALGGQDVKEVQRRLTEIGHPSYAQQAVAERALAEQIEALTVPHQEAVESPIDAACIALNGGNSKLARERWEPVVRTVLEAADKADGWLDQVVADQAMAPLKDLIVNLWLYVGRHAWTQLTTEQKELFADVVDEMNRRDYPDDPIPTERWWRE